VDIIAVVADQQAEDQFWKYLKNGAATGKFPGLERTSESGRGV
jgi:hypothetical protein